MNIELKQLQMLINFAKSNVEKTIVRKEKLLRKIKSNKKLDNWDKGAIKGLQRELKDLAKLQDFMMLKDEMIFKKGATK